MPSLVRVDPDPVVPLVAEEVADACVVAGHTSFEEFAIRAEQEHADIGGLQTAQVWAILDDRSNSPVPRSWLVLPLRREVKLTLV